MLQNAYFLAKIGADTAENEQHFAEILPKIGNYPTGSCQYLPAHAAALDAAVRPVRAVGRGRRVGREGPSLLVRRRVHLGLAIPKNEL